jgi:hypothetical protein
MNVPISYDRAYYGLIPLNSYSINHPKRRSTFARVIRKGWLIALLVLTLLALWLVQSLIYLH